MSGQQRDILRSFFQGGDRQGHHVQPVIEILTETTCLNFLVQVLVGCRDDPYIHFEQFFPANPEKLHFLQGA